MAGAKQDRCSIFFCGSLLDSVLGPRKCIVPIVPLVLPSTDCVTLENTSRIDRSVSGRSRYCLSSSS